MTNKYRSYLAIIATVAISLPAAAFADNQKGEEKKEGKGGGGGHGHSATAQEGSARVSAPSFGKVHGNSGSRGGAQSATTMSTRVRGSSVSAGAVRQSSVVTGGARRSGGSLARSQNVENAVVTAPGLRVQSQTRADQQR